MPPEAFPAAPARRSPVRAAPDAEPLKLSWRRAVDATVAAAGLAVLSLPMALTALAVRRDLGSPVLFRQPRSGRGGAVFDIAKFRTMTDARGPDGTLLPDADRTTRLSVLLRRLRLDELPQLTAVLSGHMGLIGPRPLLPATIEAFGRLGRERGRVRPGMSGWAQVSGNTRLTNAQKLALDLWYIDHRSAWLDLRIVVETVRTVLVGEVVRTERVAAAERHVLATYGPRVGTEGAQ